MFEGVFALGTVIVIATILGVLAKFLKQPLILAYIATGALIAYFGVFDVAEKDFFEVFSELGIMLLLFLVGMEINIKSLRLVGKTSLAVGLGQVVFTSVFGTLLSLLFGFSIISAAYIGIALTFSSTIIIVKLLSDKKAMNSLYGKISIGMLLVQDIVVIILLIVLSGLELGGTSIVVWSILRTLLIGAGLFAVIIWMSRYVFPRVFDKIARSQELLFLSSLAWVLALAAVMEMLGFSIEIAGFLAGVALANTSEHFQITGKIKPLRDLFLILFFVTLGSWVIGTSFTGLAAPIIVLSLFVLIGNPLIVLTIMGVMGYRRRTGFLTGSTVAQISEFSLILAALGLRLGHITDEVLALVTAVGIVTITTSTYLIVYSEQIFSSLSGFLTRFERKRTRAEIAFDGPYSKPIVLVGYNRTGKSIAASLRSEDLLIIDFDPDVIKSAREQGVESVFSDIADPEVFETVDFKKAHVVISTSPDFEDNATLVTELRNSGYEGAVILRAETEYDAKFLYGKGTDYVVLPQITSGRSLGRILHKKIDKKTLHTLKTEDAKFVDILG